MLLAEQATGHLVEVLDLQSLFNPLESTVRGCLHFGEEAQDPEHFDKSKLVFPSGEPLPQCWTDAHYRDRPVSRRH